MLSTGSEHCNEVIVLITAWNDVLRALLAVSTMGYIAFSNISTLPLFNGIKSTLCPARHTCFTLPSRLPLINTLTLLLTPHNVSLSSLGRR